MYICTYKYTGMDTKLTLRLDQEIIERAKKYASSKKQSLSRIIEIYLQSLTTELVTDDLTISPFVESMSKGKNLPLDLDEKDLYGDFLDEKYK